MRQRKLKNEQEKLEVFSRYMPQNSHELRGSWHTLFGNDHTIYVELGCGKGKFITTQAEVHPDRNYIGIEGQRSVILRALEKTEQSQLTNVLFINGFVNDIRAYFAENELAGIYLNFSDPWPKMRHEKRRLTSRQYLEGYKKVIREGGWMALKTDNADLFSFSLRSFAGFGMQIVEQSEDLHMTSLTAKEVTTEYEEKFCQMGRRIYYCKAQFNQSKE